MPAEALDRALATRALGPVFQVLGKQLGDQPAPGGLPLWGTFLRGDRGCAALFRESTAARPEAFAHVFLESRATAVEQVVESYASEAAASAVMARRLADATRCRKLAVRFGDEEVAMTLTTHSADREPMEMVTERMGGKGSEAVYALTMVQVRLGGEVMHLAFASTNPSANPVDRSVARFLEVTSAYRVAHPRPTTPPGGPPGGPTPSDPADDDTLANGPRATSEGPFPSVSTGAGASR